MKHRENCLILMLRQNATQEAFLSIRNNARQLWWLHYQTPRTFHQVLTTQMSGLGQSGKWDGSRDPDRLKNARRDDYNFVYFTPDEMHLNTSLWDLLFLQDTIMKIFKKFLHIITLGENINPRSTCWIKCKMCFDALTLYWVIKLNYFPPKNGFYVLS